MKKVMLSMLLGLAMVSFAATENTPPPQDTDKDSQEVKELPYCGAVEDILQIIKDKEGGTVVNLELETDHWTVETVAPDGTKRKYSINCKMTPTKDKKKDTSALKVPPKAGISVVELTQKIKKDFKGEIKRISFVDGKWAVCTIEGNTEKTRFFDINGNLLSTAVTN